MESVIVGHPGKQHSDQLAIALHEVGWLKAYVTGQFAATSLDQIGSLALPVMRRHAIVAPESMTIVTRPMAAAMHKFVRVSARAHKLADILAFDLFDRSFARIVDSMRPSAVVGYEMASKRTFLRARKIGAKCILDAAACHFALQDELLKVSEKTKNSYSGKLTRKKKQAEITLADIVICPSPLSANSYIAAGVAEDRVRINILGVDVERFSMPKADTRSGAARFLFVGNDAVAKGLDLLECAVTSEQIRDVPFTVDVVGAAGLHVSAATTRIRSLGKLRNSELAAILPSYDCLVLPSRLESFGMVVLEALASGVPVIVSRLAGASVLIRDGVNGWTVDANADAIAFRLGEAARHVQMLRSMREGCRTSALSYTWSSYRSRAVEIVNEVMSS
jgi:glycosyltransferase involved in cell wall biosynthesis